MADFIIIGILAVIVFFLVRGQVRRLKKGQCAGGCSGCSGCLGCRESGLDCGSAEEKG